MAASVTFTASTGAIAVFGNFRVLIGTLTYSDATESDTPASTPFHTILYAMCQKGTTGVVGLTTVGSTVGALTAKTSDTFTVMLMGW